MYNVYSPLFNLIIIPYSRDINNILIEFDDRDYYFYIICTTSTIGFLDFKSMSTVETNI